MYVYVRSVWECRYFWMSLVRMDLRSRYRGSVLGMGWSLLNPIFMSAILCIAFCAIFKQDPLERWDGRIQRHFKLGRIGADLLLEGFNLFNHATFIYNTNQASTGFGHISTDNQARVVQMAFRITY